MTEISLIPADQHFAVAAALFAIAFFGFWAERKPWGALVTGTVWSILGAIVASNIGLIPKDAPAYGFVFKYLVPALIPLFLINANIKRILFESGRVGIAFVLACIGTSVGAIVGVQLLDLGAREGDLAGIFTATYTGGSVNYAAVIQSTGFDDANIISAATAVDNLMSALFLAGLAILPASKWLMSKYAERNHQQAEFLNKKEVKGEVTGFSIAAALTFSLSVVALSDILVAWLDTLTDNFDVSRLRYVFITFLAIIPATFFPKHTAKMHGAETLGLVFAFAFFAAIAAGADITKLINVAPILLAFVSIILLIHAIFVLGLGSLISQIAQKTSANPHKNLFALSLPELITASNAAILGATTAPALAMARGWPALATPGILAGVAGYIVGTPLGIAIAAMFAP
ncbi:DUF819 family protein [Paraneptunicella aestuarii]|uniref:DUF819 family protein n=1 Tax=Paraneptunicella aestuarii TaxID=2831148 RepID=UPI001E5538AC|nr:DUF819 family protein [Paraneptunicella aestuarii]UAA39290.1 DUF819 family protein [Paraneptunicella aestuarii]